MSVLITGAAGQLGSDLARLLPEARALARLELDITDRGAVAAALEGVDLVFNCAADNAVDAAEDDPRRAMAVNAEGPAVLARACAASGARLVHFSTKYVFDGRAEAPYTEESPVSPLGAYARSKEEGERRVLEALPGALVIRSSGLFGVVGSAVKGGSFPERILRWAGEGRELRVVDDQRLNPTFTGDLAPAALELARGEVAGIVHLVPEGCASYWELAVETLRLAGITRPVARVATSAFPAKAPRPANGCLASVRVPALRHWTQGLAAWWEEFSAES